LELVKEFYAAGKVEAVWSHHRARYDQAVVEYQPTINQIILLTDGYLRMASGSFLDRQFLIIPDFLAPPNAFNARTYRDNYYLVFGPAGKLAIDEFRHQYLHFLLDPYALRFTLARDKRSATEILETTPAWMILPERSAVCRYRGQFERWNCDEKVPKAKPLWN
jgi:hypothetical protein